MLKELVWAGLYNKGHNHYSHITIFPEYFGLGTLLNALHKFS